MNIRLNTLKEELIFHLRNKILPFWMNNMIDHENGGFYGLATNEGEIIKDAKKGAVLNTRILWTFSAAYNMFAEQQYLEIASRVYHYILDFFLDKKYGGIYWMLDYRGKPVQTKKQIYAIAFAIYAFSEYYAATGSEEALDIALKLFQLVEENSYDPVYNGYFEAYSRQWELLDDLRLSTKDMNEKKTMNTHLHILEAYSRLTSVSGDESVKDKLSNMINLFIDRFVNPSGFHLLLFFDECWNLRSNVISYGHDIEATWLLTEAADLTGSKVLIEKCRYISIKMADTLLQNAIAEDGSMYYEVKEDKLIVDDRHWWPQAEAMVGFFNAYQHTGDEKYVKAVLKLWEFIKKYFVHPRLGEWYFRINKRYEPYHEEEFAGPWKCPYHNGRMCMELIRRIDQLYQK